MIPLEERLPNSITSAPSFLAARLFQEQIDPGDQIDYGWVCDYAKEKYDRELKAWQVVDDKADGIIKYLGAGVGTGIAVVTLLVTVQPITVAMVILTAPSFAVAWLAILFAVFARQARNAVSLPRIKDAYDYASAYGPSANFTFLGQWNLTCEILRVARRAKTRWLTYSFRCYVASLALLAIPLAAGIIKHGGQLSDWFTR